MKVKRLLSDFTHVSDDHAKDGSWLGQDRDPRSACLNCDPTRSAILVFFLGPLIQKFAKSMDPLVKIVKCILLLI